MIQALQDAFRSILATEILFFLAFIAFLVFTVRLVRSLPENGRGKMALGAIILLGLGLRLAWIMWTQPQPVSDFAVYWQFANAFYHGDWTYNVLIRHPGVNLLYTYAFYLFGPSLTTGWILNLFFSTVLMLLTFALTRKLVGRIAAFVAVFVAAIFPQLITYSALMATEIPGVTYFLMVMWAILESRNTVRQSSSASSWFYWAGLGLLLYGTVLIRSSNLIFLILIPAVFIFTRRDQLVFWAKRYVVMALTTGLLLSTWVYHQYLVGGAPKLFWGDALWMVCAINYERQGGYTIAPEMPFWPKVKPYYDQYAKTQSPRDEVIYYDKLSAEVWSVVAKDPQRYFLSGFPRLKRTLWTSQTGLRWTERGSETLKQVPKKLIQRTATVSNVFWQILLCLAPFGFLNWRRKNAAAQEQFLLLAFFVATWLMFYLVVAEANERYSFQLIPIVFMLALSTIDWLFAKIKAVINFKPPMTQR